jgi:segregation and condensation protein B
MIPEQMQAIIEAAIMVAGHPLTVVSLQNLFPEEEDRPSAADIKSAIEALKERYAHEHSGIELQEVASGYRFTAKSHLSPWLAKLWEERAPRYSRAFLETLVIIAYKQPITRGEIEEIRGVTVSTNIVKTLQEREWIRVIGYREIPGKPAIYGTTKEFLDYFNLKSLTDLPSLAEFKDLALQDEKLQVQLALENSDVGPEDSEKIPEENQAIIEEMPEEALAETEVTSEEDESNVVAIREEMEEQEQTETEEELVAS